MFIIIIIIIESFHLFNALISLIWTDLTRKMKEISKLLLLLLVDYNRFVCSEGMIKANF